MLVADAVLPDGTKDGEEFPRVVDIVAEYISCIPDENITMRALERLFPLRSSLGSVSFHPFTSKYKYSSVQFRMLHMSWARRNMFLTDKYPAYKEIIDSYAAKGLRVLCFARYFGGADGTQAVEATSESTSIPAPEGYLDGANTVPMMFILLPEPDQRISTRNLCIFQKAEC